METLVVVSKTKQFIKDAAGLNTSANFFPEVSKYLENSLNEAIENAAKAKRKTVMGRDFTNFEETKDTKEVLVVASKVKKLVKDKSGLNTSAQVFPALSAKVKEACVLAANQAKGHGRKTVMDRDLN